jgi:hypothetical protein
MIHDRAEVRRRWQRLIRFIGWPSLLFYVLVLAYLVGLLIYMGVTA